MRARSPLTARRRRCSPTPRTRDCASSCSMLTESDGRLPFIRVGGTSYDVGQQLGRHARAVRSEEHTSELQSLMRIPYAVFCLKKKIQAVHYASRNTHN